MSDREDWGLTMSNNPDISLWEAIKEYWCGEQDE